MNRPTPMVETIGTRKGAGRLSAHSPDEQASASDPRELYIATRLRAHGSALAEQGRFEEAEDTLATARRAYVAACGLAHPDVASCSHELGVIADKRGDIEAAAAHFVAAITAQRAGGGDALDQALSLACLARVLVRGPDRRTAARSYREAVAILADCGEDDPRADACRAALTSLAPLAGKLDTE